MPSTITCGADAVAAYGPDGTLYAGGISTTSAAVSCTTPGAFHYGPVCILVEGFDSIVSSTNNGKTWSAPVKTTGTASFVPGRFAPTSGKPASTFDRPFLAVDQSTNILYAIGHNINTHEGFVTASTNDGQSFGAIYAIDSPTYPQGGIGGGTIAAAHGVLAVSYVAASAPGATCPSTIFETGTNDGATFTRHIVTQDSPAADTANNPPLAGPQQTHSPSSPPTQLTEARSP